jgi:hypothetical protein
MLHYNQETINQLASAYLGNLQSLIMHCVEQGKTGVVFTPSDYGLGAEISHQELDQFLDEDDNDDILSF